MPLKTHVYMNPFIDRGFLEMVGPGIAWVYGEQLNS